MSGYSGGWDPGAWLQSEDADFPRTFYKTKAGHDYMDIKEWAEQKYTDKAARDEVLTNIYKSAKMMKFHPQITKDLKKTYGLLASAALRAMTPEQKWTVKRQMHPYLAAKKQIAEKVKQYKEAAGIVQRDGLRGRIGYWNTLWEADINDPKIAALITGTVDDVIKQNEKWKYDGVWEPASYTEYRAKLKDKMKAQREAIARMDPDEYKKYKYQSRALKEARKRVSAQRKATRDAWKANPDLI